MEKHDSEKDHTYAFSSDVYGYGVMCFQLIDQVKKRRRKSHPHEVDFVTGLGNACCEEDPRARPTAAMCLAKCREFLGESWTANDRVWGNPNPTERVGYWTTEMMDVGTFKKVAPKEEEEGKDSPSGLEHGETPTTTDGRTQTHGKGGRGKHSDDEDEDEEEEDDDDDEENQQINKNKKAKERELIKMLEDERRMGEKGTTTTAPAAVQAAVQAVVDAENRNGTNTDGTGTPTTTTTTSLRRRVIEAHGNTNNTNNGAKANRKRSKPATGDVMDIGVNAHAAGIENTQVAMVRSADGRITKTSSLGEDSGSQTPVSKYSRGENVASENGPPVVRRLNSLSTLGMGDLKVEETRS